jgi:hypothetical protein
MDSEKKLVLKMFPIKIVLKAAKNPTKTTNNICNKLLSSL